MIDRYLEELQEGIYQNCEVSLRNTILRKTKIFPVFYFNLMYGPSYRSGQYLTFIDISENISIHIKRMIKLHLDTIND